MGRRSDTSRNDRHALPDNMTSKLITEYRKGALILTLSGPENRNALSPRLLDAAIEVLVTARADKEVRCIILRGEGMHFSAGGDLKRLATNREHDMPAQQQQMERIARFIDELQSYPQPVIAAVEGAAAGAAFAMVLACDLVVAAEDAKFVLAYGRVGLSPDAGATWQLLQSVPQQLASQWLFLGEPVTAQRMHTLGIVNWLTPPGQSLDHALEVAERLMRGASNAIASAKELLRHARSESLSSQMAMEQTHFLRNLAHENAGEGFRAFFERRAPRFK